MHPTGRILISNVRLRQRLYPGRTYIVHGSTSAHAMQVFVRRLIGRVKWGTALQLVIQIPCRGQLPGVSMDIIFTLSMDCEDELPQFHIVF